MKNENEIEKMVVFRYSAVVKRFVVRVEPVRKLFSCDCDNESFLLSQQFR